MKVFVVPSWYPSEAFPDTGIFFKEQARLFAMHSPESQVGISLWGSHEPALWLKASRPFDSLIKSYSKMPLRSADSVLADRCSVFFTPAFTWTRRIASGNLRGILAANEQNLLRFIANYGRPDIIHAQVAYPAGAVAMQLSQKHGIPYVITEHMSPFPMPSFRFDYKRVLLPALKSAQAVLAVSQALCDRLAQFGIRAQKISNFIDDRFFTPGKQTAHAELKLLAVGRLEPQKNYGPMLDVLRSLNEAGVGYSMRIIGTGSLQKSLKQRAEAMNLRNLEWLGSCTQEEVRANLQWADLLLNTSLHENQPVSILEAFASGVEVYSFDWAGAKELVLPGLGKVLQSKEQMADACIHYQVEKRNPLAIRHLYEAHFSAAKCVSDLEAIYQRLI